MMRPRVYLIVLLLLTVGVAVFVMLRSPEAIPVVLRFKTESVREKAKSPVEVDGRGAAETAALVSSYSYVFASVDDPLASDDLKIRRARLEYLKTEPRPLVSDTLLEFEKSTFYDRLVSKIDTMNLKTAGGAHAWHQSMGGPRSSFSLSSGWLTGGSSIPHAVVRIGKHFETDEYEFAGGEISLPQTGLGIRYEENRETGEKRTLLRFERDF